MNTHQNNICDPSKKVISNIQFDGSYVILTCNVSDDMIPMLKVPDCLISEVERVLDQMKTAKIQFGVTAVIENNTGQRMSVTVSNSAAVMSYSFYNDGIDRLYRKLYKRLGFGWTILYIQELSMTLTQTLF